MTATINASTSSGLIQTADTSGELALQSNGTTQLTLSPTGAYGQLKSGTAVSASGTSVDFTSIPSWVKQITIVFSNVSTNGTSGILVQLGTSGGIENTGYKSLASSDRGSELTSTAGILATIAISANNTISGAVTIFKLNGDAYVASVVTATPDGSNPRSYGGAGNKTTAGTLDRVRITSVNGTDTFDAGSINILYEG